MTDKEIQEGNKLIAEFDSFVFYPTQKLNGKYGVFKKEGKVPYTIDELKYHSSWDWLMPVVDKVVNFYVKEKGELLYFSSGLSFDIHIDAYSKTTHVIITGRIYKCTDKGHNIDLHFDQISVVNKDKMMSVYKAVIEFIKWYNKTTTK